MQKFPLFIGAAALAMASSVAIAAHHEGGDAAPHAQHKGPDANGDKIVTRAEHDAHVQARFARMDVTGDGQINQDDRAAKRAERFAKMDSDNNGEVSQEEMRSHRDAMRVKLQERREARQARRAERRQERQAANADQRSEREAERFARMDTDKSGGLSAEEMAAGLAHRAGSRSGRGPGPRQSGQAVTAGPERVAPRAGAENKERGGHRMARRGQRGQGAMRGKAMQMFHRADTNGDKSVSQAEFTAVADARFTKMDINSDGQITQEERQAHRAERRQNHRPNHRQNRGERRRGARSSG